MGGGRSQNRARSKPLKRRHHAYAPDERALNLEGIQASLWRKINASVDTIGRNQPMLVNMCLSPNSPPPLSAYILEEREGAHLSHHRQS